MIIHLSGEVDYQMMDKLSIAFNSLPKDDNLHIYFTSPMGGISDVAVAIIDFINKNKDKIGVTFYGEIFSAGMVIFLSIEAEKGITKDTRGMYHFAWQEMSISETGKPSGEYDIFSMKEMKRSKERSIAFLKTTKLTDKEINTIKRGKDVYFSYDRMLELL